MDHVQSPASVAQREVEREERAAGHRRPSVSRDAAPLRCVAGSAQYVVERACLGKQRCAVQAAEAAFDPAGQTRCRLMSGSRQLVIHAVCAK